MSLRATSCAVLLAALGLGALARAQEPAPVAPAADPAPVRAVFVPLEGKIDELTKRTFEDRVRRAMEKKPRFLIVPITSGGGDRDASHEIAWKLNNLEGVTTVAFVKGHALSGATFVAFGCGSIAMRPDGQLGDVMPIAVDMTGLLQPEVAEKFIIPTRKDLRILAEKRGYPGDVAEAMVDPRLTLYRVDLKDPQTGRIRPEWMTKDTLDKLPLRDRDRIVAQEVFKKDGQLVTVSAAQAQDMGMCRFVVEDDQALLAALATEFSTGPIEASHVPQLWWEDVVRWLTWTPIKLLLFAVGIVALFVCLAHPGQGVPEALALLCLGTVFFGSYLIGLADSVEVVLLVIGIVLLAIELFTPGFGVVGISGIVLIGAALLLSFQRFVLPETPAEWATFKLNLLRTALGLVGALVGLIAAARFLPKSRLMRGLVLDPAPQQTGELPASPGEELVPIGTTAKAATPLRPVGKVQVGLDVFDAVVEEGFAEAGAVVVVSGHRSAQLVVSVRPEATALPAPEAPAP